MTPGQPRPRCHGKTHREATGIGVVDVCDRCGTGARLPTFPLSVVEPAKVPRRASGRQGGATTTPPGAVERHVDPTMPRERELWISGDPTSQPRWGTHGDYGQGPAGQRCKAWRQAIREAAQDAGWTPWPLEVPVELYIVLYMPKPKKPARCYPVKPDWDNGGKAPGDALQAVRRKVSKTGRVIRAALPGLAYEDDSQVASGRVRKTWVGMSAGEPGARITVRALTAEEVERF